MKSLHLFLFLCLSVTLFGAPGSVEDRVTFTRNKIKADAGDADAQVFVGMLYSMGMGVPQDDVEAAKWILKAALQGNEMAIGMMGATYEKGMGVPVDKAEALRWFTKAAGCNPKFPETRMFAEKVATWYRDGIGTDKNYDKARTWYNKAAELGSASAYYQIGLLIKNGDGVLADPAAAIIYFERAAGMGDREAIYQLGVAYQLGSGVGINPEKAAVYYKNSADLGYSYAQYNFALMLRDGTGVSKNLPLAYSLFTKASLQSVWPAQLELGVMLANGDGCERDLVEGLAWLNLAATSSTIAVPARDRLLKVISPYDAEAARERSKALSVEIAKNNQQIPK